MPARAKGFGLTTAESAEWSSERSLIASTSASRTLARAGETRRRQGHQPARQPRCDSPALTDKDLADLAFVAQHADLVGLSFVRTPADDVRALQSALAQLGGAQLGIVLKIETTPRLRAPAGLLLAAMRAAGCGVMIARGDLAVECGYRAARRGAGGDPVVCEAAHVPVIWATQVLESLAKEGMPSRAEITDAAMGERAECVMLNKGPYVDGRGARPRRHPAAHGGHQSKKRAMLRELGLVSGFRRARKAGSQTRARPVNSTQ